MTPKSNSQFASVLIVFRRLLFFLTLFDQAHSDSSGVDSDFDNSATWDTNGD